MDRQAKTLLTNLIGGTFQNTSWLTASDRERNIHEVLATENLLSNLRRKNERLIQSTATEIDETHPVKIVRMISLRSCHPAALSARQAG